MANIFQEGGPLQVKVVSDPHFLKLQNLIKEEDGVRALIGQVELKDQLQEYLQNDLIPNFDYQEVFKMQNSVAILDVSNKFGFLLIAYGNCLVVLDDKQIFEVLQRGKLIKDIKPQFYIAPSIIRYVKINEIGEDNWTAIHYWDKVTFHNTVTLYKTLKTQGSPKIPLPNNVLSADLNAGTYIRQLSFHRNPNQDKCLIVDNTKRLSLVSIQNGRVIANKGNVTSAIYNQAGDSVIATQYSTDEHILIMDPVDLSVKKSLKISFAEFCSHDYYRMYYLTDYCQNQMQMYGAYFETQEQLDSNFGQILFVWFGEDLNANTDFNQLKQRQNVKYFYETDQQHNSDEDPPAFKIQYIQSNTNPGEMFGLIAMSHNEEIYLQYIKNGKIEEFYYFSGDANHPKWRATRSNDMDYMMTLGTFQGFAALKFRIPGNNQTYIYRSIDQEVQYKYPALVLLYGIEGKLNMFHLLAKQWVDEDVLKDKVQMVEGARAQGQEEAKVPAVGAREEVKKEESKREEVKREEVKVEEGKREEVKKVEEVKKEEVKKEDAKKEDAKKPEEDKQLKLDNKSPVNPQEKQVNEPQDMIEPKTQEPQKQPKIQQIPHPILGEKGQSILDKQKPDQQQQQKAPGFSTEGLFDKPKNIDSQAQQQQPSSLFGKPQPLPKEPIIQVQPKETKPAAPVQDESSQVIKKSVKELDDELIIRYKEFVTDYLDSIQSYFPTLEDIRDSMMKSGIKSDFIQKVQAQFDPQRSQQNGHQVAVKDLKVTVIEANDQAIETLRLITILERLKKVTKDTLYSKRGQQNLAKIQQPLQDFLSFHAKTYDPTQKKKLANLESMLTSSNEALSQVDTKAAMIRDHLMEFSEKHRDIFEKAKFAYNQNLSQSKLVDRNGLLLAKQNQKLSKLNATSLSKQKIQMNQAIQRSQASTFVKSYFMEQRSSISDNAQECHQNLLELKQRQQNQRSHAQQSKPSQKSSGKYGYFDESDEDEQVVSRYEQESIYSQEQPSMMDKSMLSQRGSPSKQPKNYLQIREVINRKKQALKRSDKQEDFMLQLDSLVSSRESVQKIQLIVQKQQLAPVKQQQQQQQQQQLGTQKQQQQQLEEKKESQMQSYFDYLNTRSMDQADQVEKQRDFIKLDEDLLNSKDHSPTYLYLQSNSLASIQALDQLPSMMPLPTNYAPKSKASIQNAQSQEQLDEQRLKKIDDNQTKPSYGIPTNASFNTFGKKLFGSEYFNGANIQEIREEDGQESLNKSKTQKADGGIFESPTKRKQMDGSKTDFSMVERKKQLFMDSDLEDIIKEQKQKEQSLVDQSKAFQQKDQAPKGLLSQMGVKQETDQQQKPKENEKQMSKKDEVQTTQPLSGLFAKPGSELIQKQQSVTDTKTNNFGSLSQIKQQSTFDQKPTQNLFSSAQMETKTFGSMDAASLAAQQKQNPSIGQGSGHVFGSGTSLLQQKPPGSGLTFASYSGQQPATSSIQGLGMQQPTQSFMGFGASKPQQQQPPQFMSQPAIQQQQQPLFSQNQAPSQMFGGQQQQPMGFSAFGQINQMSGGSYGDTQNDFGSAIQGSAHVGFSGQGPTIDQSKFSDPKFLKARK